MNRLNKSNVCCFKFGRFSLFMKDPFLTDYLCYLCHVFVMLSRLFIAALCYEKADLLALVCDF